MLYKKKPHSVEALTDNNDRSPPPEMKMSDA